MGKKKKKLLRRRRGRRRRVGLRNIPAVPSLQTSPKVLEILVWEAVTPWDLSCRS